MSFALTGSHFGVALLFLFAGAWGLLWAAPELAAGRYLTPRVVAVTHLFTLGWLTTSIMGALYQLFPVVLGTRAGSERLGHAALVLYAPGLLVFVIGMSTGSTTPMLIGAALLVPGLLLFLCNAAVGLARARSRDLTWWAVAASLLFLFVTVVLGASLAGNLRWFHLGTNRLLAVGVHMHVALGGWVLLMVVGIARRLLPMFLLSHGARERAGAAAALLIGAGAALLTVLHHSAGPVVIHVAAGMLAAGTIAFLIQCARYLRHSHRPALDEGLKLALAGMTSLAAAVPLGLWALAQGFGNARVIGAYGLALVVGAFTVFVAGHYYKILPFLVWNHRFAPLVSTGRRVPRVAEQFSARTARAAFVLIATGTAALVLAVLAGQGEVARAAAVIFAAGISIEVGQMFNLFRARSDHDR